MYKVKNQKIRVWEAVADGDEILITHGELGGRCQTRRKKCTGKNKGRANETTPEQQAHLECESLHKKQWDRGYRDTIEQAESAVLYLPMLAKPYTYPLSKDVMMGQPKLDGIRCLAIWDGTTVRLQSRRGKPLHVPHIQKELAEACVDMEPGFLDGELYVHGETFQEITRRVKKLSATTETVRYCVYDCYSLAVPDRVFKHRVPLYCRFIRQKKLKHTEYVECTLVHKNCVLSAHLGYVAQGYEGMILRDPDSIYELDTRSNGLLKFKAWQDAEFRIVGHKVDQNGLCVWTCLSEGGGQFDVTPKASHAERKKMLLTAQEQYGKPYTVKFFELTEAGIPRFPVGLGIREID